MKICPVCHSKVFDDMDTCYGCMYHFGEKPLQSVAVAPARCTAQAGGAQGRASSGVAVSELPQAAIPASALGALTAAAVMEAVRADANAHEGALEEEEFEVEEGALLGKHANGAAVAAEPGELAPRAQVVSVEANPMRRTARTIQLELLVSIELAGSAAGRHCRMAAPALT